MPRGCPADVDIPGFVAAIAADDPATPRGPSSPRTSSGDVRARLPGRGALPAGCVLDPRGRPPIEIGASSASRPTGQYANGVPLRACRRANGRRVAVVGAAQPDWPAAGELAARGYAVTVFDEREEVGGLVRYAIAPYRQTTSPCRTRRGCSRELGSSSARDASRSARLQELADEVDAIVLAVGNGADSASTYEGDELEGVWESLPFIERLKTARRRAVGERVAVIGGGNTAIDVAREANRLGAGRHARPVPAYASRRCRRTRTRSTRPRGGGELRVAHRPDPLRRRATASRRSSAG